MPKQSNKRVGGHMDAAYVNKQSLYGHAPTAGVGFENEENIDLRHTVEKGIHEPSGKSIAPNATADAAKPLRNSSFGGPDTVIEHAKEAGGQQKPRKQRV